MRIFYISHHYQPACLYSSTPTYQEPKQAHLLWAEIQRIVKTRRKLTHRKLSWCQSLFGRVGLEFQYTGICPCAVCIYKYYTTVCGVPLVVCVITLFNNLRFTYWVPTGLISSDTRRTHNTLYLYQKKRILKYIYISITTLKKHQ